MYFLFSWCSIKQDLPTTVLGTFCLTLLLIPFFQDFGGHFYSPDPKLIWRKMITPEKDSGKMRIINTKRECCVLLWKPIHMFFDKCPRYSFDYKASICYKLKTQTTKQTNHAKNESDDVAINTEGFLLLLQS